MAPKVTAEVYKRIVELREKYQLTYDVIGERLSISPHTVKAYMSAHRHQTKPYSKIKNVPSSNSKS